MKQHTRRFRSLLVFGLILLIGLSAGVASGQSSLNYQIERAVLDAGGGDRSSASFTMCDSLGQPSGTTVSTSDSYIHRPGFYECGVTSAPPPPPPPPPPPAIPEPGTLFLLGAGVIGLLVFVRRTLKTRK